MSLNYKRYYRIKIGIPEKIETIAWTYECSIDATDSYNSYGYMGLLFNDDTKLNANTPYKLGNPITQTIPSDAISISNLPSEGQSVRGFDFEFTTRRSYSQKSDKNETSTLTIKNLSPDIIEYLNKEGCVVQVEAGYSDPEGLDLYYVGNVSYVRTQRGNVGINYIIGLKDNLLPIKNTKISVDYNEESSKADVIATLGRLYGSVLGNMSLETLKNSKIIGGLSLEGKLSDVINALAKKWKFEFTNFNGTFSAREKDITATDANYQKLAKNTWEFIDTDNNVIDLVEDNTNSDKLQKDKNSKRQVTITTFLTPMKIDEFFTIPPELSEDLSGTYKIIDLSFVISSTGAFQTIAKGEVM